MRIFGLDIVRVRDLTGAPEELPFRKRVERLEMEIVALTDSVEALKGMQQRLRNQFNGTKGGRPSASETALRSVEEIPVGDKAALRAAVGIRPGATIHSLNK